MTCLPLLDMPGQCVKQRLRASDRYANAIILGVHGPGGRRIVPSSIPLESFAIAAMLDLDLSIVRRRKVSLPGGRAGERATDSQ